MSYGKTNKFSDGKDKPFNYALRFLEDVADEMKDCREARKSGDLILWYNCLKGVFNMIHFKMVKDDGIADDEEKQIIKIFDDVKARFENSVTAQDLSDAFYKQAKIKLDEIDRLLNNLLYEYDFKYPKAITRLSVEEKVIEETVNEE